MAKYARVPVGAMWVQEWGRFFTPTPGGEYADDHPAVKQHRDAFSDTPLGPGPLDNGPDAERVTSVKIGTFPSFSAKSKTNGRPFK